MQKLHTEHSPSNGTKPIKDRVYMSPLIPVLLLPSLVLITLQGGNKAIMTTLIGAAFSYPFEQLSLDFMALIVCFLTTCITMVFVCTEVFAQLHSGLIFTVALLSNIGWILLLITIWFIYHVNPLLQREFSSFKPVFGRMLQSSIALPTCGLFMCALTAVYGAENTEYYLIIIMYICIRISLSPILEIRESDNKEIWKPLVSRKVVIIHIIIFLFTPILFYISIHGLNSISYIKLLSNMIILIALPILLLFLPHSNNKYRSIVKAHPLLWWTGISNNKLTYMQYWLGGGTSILVVWALEYSIIYKLLTRELYYDSTHPVFSHILILIACYSIFFAILLFIKGNVHLSIMSGTSSRRNINNNIYNWFLVFIITCYVSLYLALNSFITSNLVIILTSSLMWLFILFSGVMSKIHRIYLYLVPFFIYGYLMNQYYNNINVNFSNIISLQSLCWIIFIIGFLSIVLSSLYQTIFISSSSRTSHSIYGFILGLIISIYSIGLIVLELILFKSNADHDDYVYPSYLIMLTTFIGLYVIKQFSRQKYIPKYFLSISCVSFLCKLFILLNPSLTYICIIFSIMVPVVNVCFYYGYSTMTLERVNISTLVIHIILFGIMMIINKDTIFDPILLLFQNISQPSSSLLLGYSFILISLFWFILSLLHASKTSLFHKLSSISLLISILFAIVQPTTEWPTMYEISKISLLDAQIWSDWILFLVLVIIIISMMSILPMSRTLLGLFIGTGCGLYICGRYLPYHPVLYILFLITFNVFTLLLSFGLHNSSSKSSSSSSSSSVKGGTILYILSIILVQLLPITSLVIDNVFTLEGNTGTSTSSALKEAHYLSEMMLYGIHACMAFIIAFLFNVIHTNILINVKLMNKQTQIFTHHIYIGNFAAIECLILGIYMNSNMLYGSVSSIIVLSPVLLLLRSSKLMFPNLTSDRRYFPVLVSNVIYLFFQSIYSLILLPLLVKIQYKTHSSIHNDIELADMFGWRDDDESFEWTIFIFIREFVLLLFTLPLLYQALVFIYYQNKQNLYRNAILVPLSIVTLFFTDLLSTQLLSIMSIIGYIILYYAYSSRQRDGMKVI